jgi:hypothetical protein
MTIGIKLLRNDARLHSKCAIAPLSGAR